MHGKSLSQETVILQCCGDKSVSMLFSAFPPSSREEQQAAAVPHLGIRFLSVHWLKAPTG